jgi:transcriptional regulator of NAD metabolism
MYVAIKKCLRRREQNYKEPYNFQIIIEDKCIIKANNFQIQWDKEHNHFEGTKNK